MVYIYSIQNDFPNQKIDMGSFIDELKIENIPVENLVIHDDEVNILTLLNLTSGQTSIIDTVILNHTGEIVNDVYTEHVKIIEETHGAETQGIFQSITIDLYISGVTGTTYKDLKFPYPVSLFSSEWLVREEQVSDIAEFQLAPNTICGALTTPHSSGDTLLNVSSTVFTQADIKFGYHITINGYDLGRVIDKDVGNSTITVEYPLPVDMAPGSYVMFTIKIVPHWRFNAPGFCSVGESKIGASFIPANTTMRMVYHNISGKAKWMVISLDYLY